MVNTASLCGFTPQLGQLQELWTSKNQGAAQADGSQRLLVVAIPSNDFGEQEPWDAPKFLKFYEYVHVNAGVFRCTQPHHHKLDLAATRENYNVSFPVLAKHKVIGPEAHPFYRYTPTCRAVVTPFVMQAQHTLTRTVCTVHYTASLAAWRRQIGTFGCTSLAPMAHCIASFLAQLSPLMAA